MRLIGTPLPEDYKAFIDLYGTGIIQPAEFWVRNFLVSHDLVHLGAPLHAARNAGQLGSFNIFPEPNGLLAWGLSNFGHYCCWKVGGEPAAWEIVIFFDDMTSHLSVSSNSMTGLVAELLELSSSLVGTVFHKTMFAPPQGFQALEARRSTTRTWTEVCRNNTQITYKVANALILSIPLEWNVVDRLDIHNTSLKSFPEILFISQLFDRHLPAAAAPIITLFVRRNSASSFANSMLLRDAILESFAKQEKCNGAVGAQENQEDFVGFIRESLSTAEIQTPHIVVGELTSECKTVPWIRFQRYEGLVVVCFFYAHHGSWLLEFECPSFTIDNWIVLLDEVASSVGFE